MKYQKQTLFVAAVLAVAAVFWGVDAWQHYKLNADGFPALAGGTYTEAVVRDGVSYLVPGDDVYDTNVGVDGIPALTNPKFVAVAEADDVTADDLYGIDVEVGGEHRYYPFQIMNWHEVVNDTFAGKHLVVTYCTLCGSAMVYEAPSEDALFGVSGKVYNDNALLYDKKTNSLWLQETGQAVVGSAVGDTLALYPSVVMKWSDWKSAYPNGEVLSTDTGFTRDYTRHPYGSYETSNAMYFPLNHTSKAFQNKWVVNVVHIGGETAAFARTVLKGVGAQEDVVGGEAVLALYDRELEIGRVFSRVVDGVELAFSYDADAEVFRDLQTSSAWSAEGVATSGSMKGARLTEISSNVAYWVCVQAMYPDARPIGGESAKAASETSTETTIDITGQNVTN